MKRTYTLCLVGLVMTLGVLIGFYFPPTSNEGVVSPALEGERVPAEGRRDMKLPPTNDEPGAKPEPERLDASGLVDRSVRSGHPELGFYPSKLAIEADIKHVCLSFLGEDWIAEQTHWRIGFDTFSFIPFSSLFPKKELTEAERILAKEAVAATNLDILMVAEEAYLLIQHNAQKYSLALKPILRDEPTRFSSNGQPNVSYFAGTVVNAGLWKYVVDFSSADYPDLESKLLRIAKLQDERKQIVRDLFPS